MRRFCVKPHNFQCFWVSVRLFFLNLVLSSLSKSKWHSHLLPVATQEHLGTYQKANCTFGKQKVCFSAVKRQQKEESTCFVWLTKNPSLMWTYVFFHPLGGLALWWYKSFCVPILPCSHGTHMSGTHTHIYTQPYIVKTSLVIMAKKGYCSC